MKNSEKSFCLGVVIGALVLAMIMMMIKYNDTKPSSRYALCIAYHGYLVDNYGEQWDIDTNDLEYGHQYLISFDTCGTEDIYDDIPMTATAEEVR